MKPLTIAVGFVALILHGAIFGFFFAWVCSTLWGLDQLPPNVAIEAMQAMNASVRNAVFAPAFFATPIVAVIAGGLCAGIGARRAAFLFVLGGLVYLGGGLILTVSVNVPMNEALALVSLPLPVETAQAIWSDYSAAWQVWNQIRTGFSGLALALCGLGIWSLARATG